ncbi:MAG TPA: plasmid pRiA4b ORF-3 family protein [Actinomycetes bacterium]|nr:plasmid pRiA4b ORF-3 family protein [Actinomycetes bacterium]
MSRRPATSTSTYVFRVRILGGFYAPPGGRGIWRELELAVDQTLAELGECILAAFGFEDDHLWSFFLSGRPWDRASEYARLPDPPVGDRKRGVRVGAAPPREEFLFLFDYGDEWHFGVRLVRTGEVEPGARYPRVVASQGQAPPQYLDLDEEDDWDEASPTGLAPPRFAPVELAPPPELRAASAAAPTVRRLRALVDWLGDGRRLTVAGNLTLADGKELAARLGLVDPDRLADLHVRSAQDIAGLELLVGWARAVRLARVHKGQLVSVKQHRHLLDDPLELFHQAAAVLPLLDRALPLTDMIDSSFPGGLAEALLDLLSLLYAPEAPVTMGELAGHFWEEHVEALLEEHAARRLELWRLATAIEIAQYLGLLQDLGIVELGGGSVEPAVVTVDPESDRPADAYLSSVGEVAVRLTPLGTWWTNVLLRGAGAVAPVIGEPAGTDGEAEVRSMLAAPELRPPDRLRLVGQGPEDPASLDPAAYKAAFKLDSPEPR